MNKQKQQMYKILASLMSGEDIDIVFDANITDHADFHMKDRVIRIAPLAKHQEHLTTGLVIHETAHAIYTNGDAPMNRVLNIVEDGYIERMVSKKYNGAKKHLREIFDEFFDEPTPQGSLIVDILNVLNYNCKGIKYGKTVPYPSDVLSDDVQWFRESVEMTTIPAYDDRAGLADEVKKRLLKYGSENEIPEGHKYGSIRKSDIDIPEELLDALDIFIESKKDLLNDHHDKFEHIDGIDFDDAEEYGETLHAEIATPDILYKVSKIIDIKDRKIYGDESDFKKEMVAARKRAITMYQRFLIKRNALAAQKTQYHTSGSLDVKRLVHYQTNEDIFKRSEIRPDGTNHGVVMMLDWSASMNSMLLNVWRRIAEFAEFARMADIQLIAYAFTTDYRDIIKSKCKNMDFPTSCLIPSKFIKVIDTTTNQNIHDSLHKLYDVVDGSKEDYDLHCTNINEGYTFARHEVRRLTATNKTIMMVTDGDDDGWNTVIAGDKVSNAYNYYLKPRFMGDEFHSDDLYAREVALQAQIEYMSTIGVKSAGIFLKSGNYGAESIEERGKIIYNGRYLMWKKVNDSTKRENKFINTIVDLIL